jgi:hypothetical protein
MMKTRMTQWVMTATLTICGAMMMLTSCTDAIGTVDNPVKPEPPYDPAEELAKETFDHDAWIDRSVKPGDAFWHFAIGGWLKTRDADDFGTINDLSVTIKKRLNQNVNNYDSPVAGKLFKLLNQPAPDKSEEVKVITDFLSTLKLDGDVSKADLIRNFGKLYDIGCPALVLNVIGPLNGQMKCYLVSGIPYSINFLGASLSQLGDQNGEVSEDDNPIKFVLSDLMGLDFDSPDIKAKADEFDKIESKLSSLFYGTAEKDNETGVIRLKRIQPATLQSLADRRTRGDEGEDLKAVFNEAFHIEEATHIDESVDKVLAILDEYSTDTWLLYQQYYVYGRFSAMFRCTNYYDNIYNTIQRVKTLAPSATIDYEMAMLLGDCDVEGCREILENMRQRMSQRIEQLDWLSSATKANALEKLQAMVFSVGKPDELYNADFKLTGNTAVEVAMQYMRQLTEYQRTIDGEPAYGNGWDYLNANVVSTISLSSTNAFYVPQFNQLFIIPAYMMSQIFPTDKDNAQRYAVSMVFGHEMTHGFDPTGAKYDAHGFEKNWWTDGDMAQFKLLQQQMIDRYNELEVVPGVMADGEKTLNENVADLGGVTLAYDLWNEKLKADGFTGEALRHLQRQFFLSYAVVWNLYRSDEDLLDQIKTDEHSASFNRVNGISRLLDDWYTLFGVEPGDKLYVKPTNRVKIW